MAMVAQQGESLTVLKNIFDYIRYRRSRILVTSAMKEIKKTGVFRAKRPLNEIEDKMLEEEMDKFDDYLSLFQTIPYPAIPKERDDYDEI